MTQILITRPRAQADDFADKLRAAGFEPILFPVIEIRPVEDNTALARAIEHLETYAWVVFTSVNAVDAVFSPPSSLRDTPPIFGENGGSWRGVKVAAIGPKTAEALRQRGIEPDFVPDEYVAEAVLPGLGDLQSKWVLLPRAEIARADLPEAISKAGGIPHEIIVYRTLPAAVDLDGLNALKSGMDIITFTSASTVENFAALCQQNRIDPLNLPNHPLIACIGPITAQAAREAGFENVVVAEEYTTDGLVEEIVNRYTSRQVNRSTSTQVPMEKL